jgi:hypothetical protein
MAKYKLLIDIVTYNYGGGNPPKVISEKFVIPKGTIVDITPQPYSGTTNFSYIVDTKYGKTNQNNFDNGSKDEPSITIEKVSENTPVTLDAKIIPKNVSSNQSMQNISSGITNVVPETFLQKHKNHLLILGGLVLGYLAFKKFNK